MDKRINLYSEYLTKKYNAPTFRVGVDGGFSCPNRGEDRTRPGCAYCCGNGSRAPYLDKQVSFEGQIEKSIAFLKKRYGAKEFLLYFQAFSSTYSFDLDILRQRYDKALSYHPFRELIVSTRPDCVDKDICELLASYKSGLDDVWVELGLQSMHERTLDRIKRGHGFEQFKKAVSICHRYGLNTAVHLILGLPGESAGEMMGTVRAVAELGVHGIKFHNLLLPRDTELYHEYLAGELSLPCTERYMEYLIEAIELLPPEVIVMRLTCDHRVPGTPGRLGHKTRFHDNFHMEMKKRGACQGRLYEKQA